MKSYLATPENALTLFLNGFNTQEIAEFMNLRRDSPTSDRVRLAHWGKTGALQSNEPVASSWWDEPAAVRLLDEGRRLHRERTGRGCVCPDPACHGQVQTGGPMP